MSANDIQIAGDHYKKQQIQPWDFIPECDLNFFEGNVLKYTSRWRSKNGMVDLEKVAHFIDKMIELKGNGDLDSSGHATSSQIDAYCLANKIYDFRERIIISIVSGGWNLRSLSWAQLLIKSLIEEARNAPEEA